MLVKTILFFSVLTFSSGFSQTQKDSLAVVKLLKMSRKNEQNNIDESFKILTKIEAYSKKNNYKKGNFIAQKERAYIYYTQQKYDSANVELQKINIRSLQLNAIEKARFFNLKGIVFQAKEIADSSLHYLNKSLDEYKKIKDSEGIITSLSNIGIYLYQTGLQQEALQNFEEAYRLSIQLKQYKNLPVVINNYASLLTENGQIIEAEKLFKSLLEDTNLNNNNNLKATLLQNWASFQKTRGDFKKAIEWYHEAIFFSESKNLPVLSKNYCISA